MTIDIADFDGARRTVKTLDEGTFLVAGPDTTARIGRLTNFIFFSDMSAAQTAGQVSTGPTRDSGFGSATPHVYGYYTAFARSSHAGSFKIQGSFDASAWLDATGDIAVAANTPVFQKIPIVFRHHRVIYTNGGTASTALQVTSSYGVA